MMGRLVIIVMIFGLMFGISSCVYNNNKVVDTFTMESVEYIKGGWIANGKSEIITTEGCSFFVYGCVDHAFGQKIEITRCYIIVAGKKYDRCG